MRIRAAIVVILTVTAYITAALLWRQVFPFRDGIAEFLPEGTIAYVHVNLTPAVRRALRVHLDNPEGKEVYPKKYDRIFLGTSFRTTMRAALDESDVRELGFVWYQSDTGKPTDPKITIVENWSRESLGPFFAGPGKFALIIGQRASQRPDVVPEATVTVGEQEVRVFVVRVSRKIRLPTAVTRKTRSRKIGYTLSEPHRHPVQATLWPRELPVLALDAARHLLPETITASGTLSRHGFILRGDQKKTIVENWLPHLPFITRSARIELLSEPRPGALQIMGVPVRELAKQLELPFHGELRAAIEPLIPEYADFLIENGHVAVRIPAPIAVPSEAVLRSLAARIWTVTRRRLLDGLSAEVLIADPETFEIVADGSNRWVLRSREDGKGKLFAEQSGDFVYMVSKETAFDSVELLVPSPCRFDSDAPLIVWPLHPQVVVTASVDRSGSNVAICGRIAQQEN